MDGVIRRSRAVSVVALIAASMSMIGCSQGEGQRDMMDTESPQPTASVENLRSQGDAALRIVLGVPGGAWPDQTDATPSAWDCEVGSEGTPLLFQWAAQGGKVADGEGYVAKVASALRDAGYHVSEDSTTLKTYGTSYRATGSKDLISAVVVASNDTATSVSIESVCAPGNFKDYPH